MEKSLPALSFGRRRHCRVQVLAGYNCSDLPAPAVPSEEFRDSRQVKTFLPVSVPTTNRNR